MRPAVKRWDISEDEFGAEMRTQMFGEFVTWEDFDSLHKSHKMLEAELARVADIVAEQPPELTSKAASNAEQLQRVKRLPTIKMMLARKEKK